MCYFFLSLFLCSSLFAQEEKWDPFHSIRESVQAREELGRQDARSAALIAKLTEEFFALIRKGTPEKAYFTLLSEEFRKETPLPAFLAFLQRFPLFAKARNLSIGPPKFYGTKAISINSATEREGGSKRIEITWTSENGKWKILGISIYPDPSS